MERSSLTRSTSAATLLALKACVRVFRVAACVRPPTVAAPVLAGAAAARFLSVKKNTAEQNKKKINPVQEVEANKILPTTT